ncbi:hypothetical protein PANT_14c00066 [Moesziomyces antarcticus T-34]|uniref:PH domain-containing protein n=1 Tax=Pseudozyma antarctica (strain T-34) TaxID=1151754 RepID=M9LX97_PSEA3|nr:hypothetical protein PANT_14c00066 [Moesziomyces antarcticus T-34]
MTSKAEFVASAEAHAPALTSSVGGLAAIATPDTDTRPQPQSRRSSRTFGRTSNFLSTTLLRPRGKSISASRTDEWSRPVGGSEGLGTIYNASMGSRERSQVMRSVTTLTKSSENDVTGAVAEAFSGNATPSLSPRMRFFSTFRADSSNNVPTVEAPPSYQTQRPDLRRGSEGSVVSHVSLPRHDATSSRSSFSRRSSSRTQSFFDATSSSFASSNSSSLNTSVSASPGPEHESFKQQLQSRRNSTQLGAATRQAFRNSRSFLGTLSNAPSGRSSQAVSPGSERAPITSQAGWSSHTGLEASDTAKTSQPATSSALMLPSGRIFAGKDSQPGAGDAGADAVQQASAAAANSAASRAAAAGKEGFDGSFAASNSSLANSHACPIGKANPPPPTELSGRRCSASAAPTLQAAHERIVRSGVQSSSSPDVFNSGNSHLPTSRASSSSPGEQQVEQQQQQQRGQSPEKRRNNATAASAPAPAASASATANLPAAADVTAACIGPRVTAAAPPHLHSAAVQARLDAPSSAASPAHAQPGNASASLLLPLAPAAHSLPASSGSTGPQLSASASASAQPRSRSASPSTAKTTALCLADPSPVVAPSFQLRRSTASAEPSSRAPSIADPTTASTASCFSALSARSAVTVSDLPAVAAPPSILRPSPPHPPSPHVDDSRHHQPGAELPTALHTASSSPLESPSAALDSSSSSSTNLTTAQTTAVNTSTASTAATTPSQSTLKLTSASGLPIGQTKSILPSVSFIEPRSHHHEHVPLHLDGHLGTSDPVHSAAPVAAHSDPEPAHTVKIPSSGPTFASPSRASCDDRRTLPLTPPDSIGQCLSPRTSVSGGLPEHNVLHGEQRSDPIDVRTPHSDLPSPAPSAHGSSSGQHSRRASAFSPSASPLDTANQSQPSSTSPLASTNVASTASEASSPPSTGSKRVSFDFRRLPFLGGATAANKMPSDVSKASNLGVAMPQEPLSPDSAGLRSASSSSTTTSKFFSRISLPGSSRRGSATDSPLATPEPKSRSRFASFGRFSRGSDARTSPNRSRNLRNSMQPWASASTDVLGSGSAFAQGRNSMALARDEAARPRKSLHLPRTNLIDLESEDTLDATATDRTGLPALDTRTIPPIAPPAAKAEKPASPSFVNAKRPSFNFLRRPSAASINSNAEVASGERRGSRGSTNAFARTFMNRTLSRNSKSSDTPSDSARATLSSTGDSATPIFRNGIFDSQAPVSTSNVAYPGMSPTVNWNTSVDVPPAARADVAPNEIDPTVAIPPYPGSAASMGTVQPRGAVAELSSSVLAERRPSQGIDQEQDAVEATDTVPASMERAAVPPTSASQSTDSNPSRQRQSRSSNALSHLPRLNSMRAIGKPGSAGSQQASAGVVRTTREGSESTNDGTTPGETSEEEQELSEDDEEADTTGQTSDYQDLDTETDDETDEDNNPSPVVSRRVSAAPMTATGSSGGLNRNRPTESLILPPAPSFVPNSTIAAPAQGASAAASTTGTSASSDATFTQHVGRDAWTSFNMNGFTPFETPTPSLGGGANNFAARTPRARQELSESSYFAARPGTSNSGRATTAGTMSGDVPPPSPSIISRSRAPSSASMRTLRTPGNTSTSSGPVPNRSMPTPGGNLPSLALHRQISAASTATRTGIERSKSPALGAGSSRPSTSGTVTPNQVTAGDRSASREPSIDRPGSERPTSRNEISATAKTNGRAPMALRGVSPSGARPTFYQQKSQSLVDLMGPASRRLEIDTHAAAAPPTILEPTATEALRTPTTPRPPSEAPAYSKRDLLEPINTKLTAPASIASPGAMSLGRRRSMFEMRAEPPPYSIIHNRPEGPQVILPREEEGREKLPTYCCGIHIEGYLPRKMEFSAPGVQAKDRSWRRQYFVLHGTSLRVYKNDLSVERHAATGTWGEMKGVHVHLEPMNEDGSNHSGSGMGLGAAAREAISHTPLGSHRNESGKGKEASTQFDSKNGLVRNYTLQSAESGLAADYLKRRHVVRVRAEGEQFLLQTRSDRHVVDWIEALQAATNVSMDLESRAMPKFITLPRRRRRRRRNADGTTLSPEEQERRDLAEAQRRSMAEAGGPAAGTSEVTPRTSMSQTARQSMSLENELNPSAAFEEMLREDQEEGGRRTAAVM